MIIRGNDIASGSVTGCSLRSHDDLKQQTELSKQTEPDPMSLPLNHLS